MSKRVPCKFFANGRCLKGERCSFLHEQGGPSSNICFTYQKGTCTYGARCRYQHVKVSQSPGSDLSPLLERMVLTEHRSGIAIAQDEGAEHSDRLVVPAVEPTQRERSGNREMQRTNRGVHRADLSLCEFPTAGECPRGERCPHVHGDLCSTCGRHCLHPFRPKEREEHIETCQKRQKQLEAIRLSKDIECNVCLEHVLSKRTPAERKFGILPECNHPFCLSCIRNWRRTSDSRLYTTSAVRACPTCRTVSYFVVPSSMWYSSNEEKQEIISNYKENLSSIDCKHFNFGNGKCPFGSSCFYKHTVKPGSSLWNATLNPGSRSSRYQDMYEDEESEDTDGITDMAFEAMFSEITREISRYPDLYASTSEGLDGIGPIENPNLHGVQLLYNHLYHPRHLMGEGYDHDDEVCSEEESPECFADFLRMVLMMQAHMANGSSDDE